MARLKKKNYVRSSLATVCSQEQRSPPQSPAGNLRRHQLRRLQPERGDGLDECHPAMTAFVATSK